MIPTPPSHCSIPRQSLIPSGSASSPLNTVAPVVVSPDIASKNASVKLALVAPITKGIAPKSGSVSHTSEVKRKVCRRLNPASTPFEQASAINPPVSIVTIDASRKTVQWPFWAYKSEASGASMVNPSVATSRPITYPIGRKSNMRQGWPSLVLVSRTSPAELLKFQQVRWRRLAVMGIYYSWPPQGSD